MSDFFGRNENCSLSQNIPRDRKNSLKRNGETKLLAREHSLTGFCEMNPLEKSCSYERDEKACKNRLIL